MADNSKAIVRSMDEHPDEWTIRYSSWLGSLVLDHKLSGIVVVKDGNEIRVSLIPPSVGRLSWFGEWRVSRAINRLIVVKGNEAIAKKANA